MAAELAAEPPATAISLSALSVTKIKIKTTQTFMCRINKTIRKNNNIPGTAPTGAPTATAPSRPPSVPPSREPVKKNNKTNNSYTSSCSRNTRKKIIKTIKKSHTKFKFTI